MVRYESYKVAIEFTRRVVGALPKNPDVIDAWAQARAKKNNRTEEEAREIAEKIKEEVQADIVEKSWVCFKSDDTGLYLEDRNIKAMLRECATTLGTFRGTGSVAKRQTFQHGLFVEPERIYFMRDGKPITEPDGQQERAIHVMTAMGPRDSLKREDYIDLPASMEFRIDVVVQTDRKQAFITEEILREWFDLGQRIGLGGSRSQQFGKFKVVSFEKV